MTKIVDALVRKEKA